MGAGAFAQAFWLSAPGILVLGLQQGRGGGGSPPCRGAGVWEGGEVVWLDGEDAEEGGGVVYGERWEVAR